jgi:hypothetical protein
MRGRGEPASLTAAVEQQRMAADARDALTLHDGSGEALLLLSTKTRDVLHVAGPCGASLRTSLAISVNGIHSSLLFASGRV